ncbi:DUF3298 and DUF4163 domain-containing protein [Pseudogracilibacillus auburnensis]|uniref:DUF3298 and DUF4163 domain-containing protein n=1 Tax=Pseudogracilibacillus auburnensis TaxID=1494959 RepID=UPI001A97BB01|nr:DUF3298 and DUF4163 domain-containing protein [Pseudogracilibacillus auburnensis]MBO1001394.1 DUF3298 and DUF4163 domain-containing protein [Pseudogracilibacillus auburnensis]
MDIVAFPVMTKTNIIHQREKTIYYPVVFGMKNMVVQSKVNQDIFHLVQKLIHEQYVQQNTNEFVEMLGTYEIKTNDRHILSLSLSNYAIFYHAAHGLTIMKSLTFNMETGKSYVLKDLFKPDSNYVEVLSDIIRRQINERNIPLLEPFTTIRPDQDFYIADKALVIYFQLYEITPYYIGFPMFPISVFELEGILREDGPLGVMATNN